jgi:7-cyano-7-deazaguanine synthase in queuosine biosynthesis
MTKKISLMFSGGIDSTMTAVLLAKKYDEIHLLTYNNGYGHMFMNTVQKRVNELNSMFDNKFEYSLMSTKDLFEKIIVNNVVNEVKTHKSGFVWCLGCKYAMHAKSIIYNKKNNILEMTDGSSKSTKDMVEQKPFSVKIIKHLYKNHGIKFHTPVYNIPREESIKKLKKLKFNMGWFRVLDRFIGIQPKCFAGEIYYMPNLVFGKTPKHDNKEIYKFYLRKQNILEECIKNGML